MAGVKGRSGTNRGRGKPFAEALQLEINAAGADHKKLRAIARKLLAAAESGDMQAIAMVADRLDGKPVQENNTAITNITASQLSDDELADIARGGSEDADPSPVDPQTLN